MRKALDQQDFHAGAELAHKAKGSCGTIGALQAQKLCANLQQSLDNGNLPPQEALDMVFIVLAQVLREAKEYVSNA